jgi:hypothetical protein
MLSLHPFSVEIIELNRSLSWSTLELWKNVLVIHAASRGPKHT